MIRRQEMNSAVLTERLSYLADQTGKVIFKKNVSCKPFLYFVVGKGE